MSDCRRRSCWDHRCRPMSPCSGHSVHPWWSAGARWSAARKLRQKHASTSSLSNPFKNLDWFYIEFIDASLFLFSALNGSLSYFIVYFLMCWCHLKQKPCRRCGWWLTCRQFRLCVDYCYRKDAKDEDNGARNSFLLMNYGIRTQWHWLTAATQLDDVGGGGGGGVDKCRRKFVPRE